MRPSRLLPLLALLLATALPVADAIAASVGTDDALTSNGRKLDPVGRMTKLGPFPTGGALTPNGRFYWAVDAGRGTNRIRIISVRTGTIVQRLPIPGGYVGVAFGPGGQRAYVSGEPAEGDLPDSAKGLDGDVIHVYAVKRRTGKAREVEPLKIPPGTVDGAAASDELPPASGVNAWPEGLAVTPDGKYVVVALGQADQVAIIDRHSGDGKLADVGRYPYGVAIDPRKPQAYVTNERDGTVSVIGIPSGKALGTVPVGMSRLAYSHPEGLVADPRRHRLYVAVTDRDRVAVIDTDSLKLERAVFVGHPALPIGSAPINVGLSKRDDTLYVANAGEDSILGLALERRRRTHRACRLHHRRRRGHGPRKCLPKGAIGKLRPYDVIGRMPTAAYPTDVEATPDGKRLVWLASKGLGTGPNPGDESIKELLRGRTGIAKAPTDKRLRRLDKRARRELVPTNYQEPPKGTPLVGPDGGPSHEIKHVFYVVKENRTYDQIFGSNPVGDGDPDLELFDDNGVSGPAGGITPNAHALARRFALYDHVFANSEESTVGHKITAGGYANDYTERYVFTNRGRKGNPDIFPIGIPPNAFIFDQAVRQDIGFHIYGELGAGNQPFADDGRPTYPQVQLNTDAAYPTQIQGTCNGAIPFPDGTPLSVRCTADAGTVGKTSGRPAVSSRAGTFQTDFDSQLADEQRPRLQLPDPLQRSHRRDDPRCLYAGRRRRRQRPRPRPDRAADLALEDLEELGDLRPRGRLPGRRRPPRCAPDPGFRDLSLGQARRAGHLEALRPVLLLAHRGTDARPRSALAQRRTGDAALQRVHFRQG